MGAKFPVLKVIKILDKATLVLGGEGVGEVREDEKLIILGQGPDLEGLGVPLFVPKAEIEVTAHAGDYLIAAPPGKQVEEPVTSVAAMLYGVKQTRTVIRREPLAVADSELSGNPASRAVTVGDPVIRGSDLKAYVQSLRGKLKQT